MSTTPVNVAVIIGSTRAGRFAPTVASWFVDHTGTRDDVVVDVIDLAEGKLSETLGALGVVPTSEVAVLTARLAAAEAFVIVTPEYNHSYPAPLKSAIDWHYEEWMAKPVAFVSYGGLSGGLRAVEHLRQVFAEVHAVTIRDTVSFHGARNQFGPDGVPIDPAGCAAAADVLLNRLVWWARALTEARAKRPY